MYGPHITAIKSSILLLYLRLFGIRKPFKIAILVTEALVVAWCISIIFSGIFQANPISAIWYPKELHTQVDYTKYLLGTAVPNVVTDFVILILPVSMVWQLQISKRRKRALCGVFLLGTLYIHQSRRYLIDWLTSFASVCVVSIVRAYMVATIDNNDASCKSFGYTRHKTRC